MPERGLHQLTLRSLGSSTLRLWREAVENLQVAFQANFIFQSRRSLTLWDEDAPPLTQSAYQSDWEVVLCCFVL